MVGLRIKDLRRHLRLNQTDFGSRLGVTHGAISQIEKDKTKPSSQLLTAMSAIYDVNLEWLETGQGEMFKNTDSGLERFSPAQKVLVEKFTGYFAEKVPIPETDETMEVVRALINILMSKNESAKRAIKSSILAVNQTLDGGEIESPGPKSNPGSRTKRTKVG